MLYLVALKVWEVYMHIQSTSGAHKKTKSIDCPFRKSQLFKTARPCCTWGRGSGRNLDFSLHGRLRSRGQLSMSHTQEQHLRGLLKKIRKRYQVKTTASNFPEFRAFWHWFCSHASYREFQQPRVVQNLAILPLAKQLYNPESQRGWVVARWLAVL